MFLWTFRRISCGDNKSPVNLSASDRAEGDNTNSKRFPRLREFDPFWLAQLLRYRVRACSSYRRRKEQGNLLACWLFLNSNRDGNVARACKVRLLMATRRKNKQSGQRWQFWLTPLYTVKITTITPEKSICSAEYSVHFLEEKAIMTRERKWDHGMKEIDNHVTRVELPCSDKFFFLFSEEMGIWLGQHGTAARGNDLVYGLRSSSLFFIQILFLFLSQLRVSNTHAQPAIKNSPTLYKNDSKSLSHLVKIGFSDYRRTKLRPRWG